MREVQYPINGFSNACEVIAEAKRTGKQICDLLGNGLPEDYTQDQLIAAYRNGECTEEYLAARLKLDLVSARRLMQERQL